MNTSWSGTRDAFPRQTRRRILARYPVCCCRGCPRCATLTRCSRPSTEADHRTPVAEGGTHDETNGQGLCSPCHDHKTKAEADRGRARRRARGRRPDDRRHPGIRA